MEEIDEIPDLVQLEDESITPQSKQLKVTILTGFLGSGKTTLLSYLLTANHGKRIAIIENEFSAGLGIESIIAKSGVTGSNIEGFFELNNGCICCTVKDSLISTLEQLARHSDRFDYIIIEMTGLANPGPVITSFWLDDAVPSALKLDGVVCLVDGSNIEHYLSVDDIASDIRTQIAYADRILLNKCDLISQQRAEVIAETLREINGVAEIQQTSFSRVSPDWVLNIDSFALKQDLLCPPCKPSRHAAVMSTHSFEFPGEVDLRALERFLDHLLYSDLTASQQVYRIKGVFHAEGDDRLHVLQGIHDMFEIKPTSIRIHSEEDTTDDKNRVIAIGKHLDPPRLERGLRACVAT